MMLRRLDQLSNLQAGWSNAQMMQLLQQADSTAPGFMPFNSKV